MIMRVMLIFVGYGGGSCGGVGGETFVFCFVSDA